MSVQTIEATKAPSANASAIKFWNTVLFDKFSRFEWVLTSGLREHGDVMLRRYPPRPGAHVLEIGCGFGDMTRQLIEAAGPLGRVAAMDAAWRFVEATAQANGESSRTRFFTADAQSDALGGPFDLVVSRFSTMFFASPVAALRNMRRSLRPEGELRMVVWRKREDNAWLHVAERCVERVLGPAPVTSDAVTCGPGPFSMASADVVSDQRIAAGFSAPRFDRVDTEICVGRSLEEAIDFALTLGPAGERMRLDGALARRREGEVREALRACFSPYLRNGEVWMPSSTWIVRATNAGS